MKVIVSVTVLTMCMYLLRSVWRMLVEIPDSRQVWVPDAVEDFLTRWSSAALILDCGLLLVLVAQNLY